MEWAFKSEIHCWSNSSLKPSVVSVIRHLTWWNITRQTHSQAATPTSHICTFIPFFPFSGFFFFFDPVFQSFCPPLNISSPCRPFCLTFKSSSQISFYHFFLFPSWSSIATASFLSSTHPPFSFFIPFSLLQRWKFVIGSDLTLCYCGSSLVHDLTSDPSRCKGQTHTHSTEHTYMTHAKQKTHIIQ